MLHLGTNIKGLRMKKGASQEQLAYDLGVSSQTISRWENGVTYPDVTMLPIIAEHFGVTIDLLMGYQKECTRDEREAFFAQIRELPLEARMGRIREMLKTYPNDAYLQFSLAGVLHQRLKRRPDADMEAELLRLCHAIRGTDVPGIQCGAIRLLALMAAKHGEREKAMCYVNELPSALCGREIVAEMVLRDVPLKTALAEYARKL